MFEVLNDVQLACNTSVEILNDLLCFDKIEGGILELHKQEVPVTRFLTETCRQFTGMPTSTESTDMMTIPSLIPSLACVTRLLISSLTPSNAFSHPPSPPVTPLTPYNILSHPLKHPLICS